MDLNTLREYLKIHLVSLEQDIQQLDKWDDNLDMEFNYLTGQQVATAHILEYINE